MWGPTLGLGTGNRLRRRSSWRGGSSHIKFETCSRSTIWLSLRDDILSLEMYRWCPQISWCWRLYQCNTIHTHTHTHIHTYIYIYIHIYIDRYIDTYIYIYLTYIAPSLLQHTRKEEYAYVSCDSAFRRGSWGLSDRQRAQGPTAVSLRNHGRMPWR